MMPLEQFKSRKCQDYNHYKVDDFCVDLGPIDTDSPYIFRTCMGRKSLVAVFNRMHAYKNFCSEATVEDYGNPDFKSRDCRGNRFPISP